MYGYDSILSLKTSSMKGFDKVSALEALGVHFVVRESKIIEVLIFRKQDSNDNYTHIGPVMTEDLPVDHDIDEYVKHNHHYSWEKVGITQ